MRSLLRCLSDRLCRGLAIDLVTHIPRFLGNLGSAGFFVWQSILLRGSSTTPASSTPCLIGRLLVAGEYLVQTSPTLRAVIQFSPNIGYRNLLAYAALALTSSPSSATFSQLGFLWSAFCVA